MFRKLLGVSLILVVLLATTGSMMGDEPPPTEEPGAEETETPPEEVPPEEPPAPRPILETLEADPQFSKFVELLKATEVDKDLQGYGTFTVFAPNNEAFDNMADGILEHMSGLPDGGEVLGDMLRYHMVKGKYSIAQVSGRNTLKSLQGEDLYIKWVEEKLLISGAEVIVSDIQATNGVIHIIKAVTMPQRGYAEDAKAKISTPFVLTDSPMSLDLDHDGTNELYGVYNFFDWNQELVVSWKAFPFEDVETGSYHIAIWQYNPMHFSGLLFDGGYYQIKSAHHWATKAYGWEEYTIGSLGWGEGVCWACPSYIIIQPEIRTHVEELAYDEYTLIEDEIIWTEPFALMTPLY